MDFNVVSWNMQGWGNQYQGAGVLPDEKMHALFRSIQNFPLGSTVIMLQECGNPEITKMTSGSIWTSPITHENFICHVNFSDPTAYVKRCSTAILVSENLDVTDSGILMPYGVTRPLVCVGINGICFSTIHAIANRTDSISQVKASIKELMDKNINNWLMMGDFNSEPTEYTDNAVPERLNDVIITGTVSRPGYGCKMIYSRNPTQGRDGNRTASLDFAFISSNAAEANVLLNDGLNGKVINIMQLAGQGMYLSDHNLVGLRLSV